MRMPGRVDSSSRKMPNCGTHRCRSSIWPAKAGRRFADVHPILPGDQGERVLMYEARKRQIHMKVRWQGLHSTVTTEVGHATEV